MLVAQAMTDICSCCNSVVMIARRVVNSSVVALIITSVGKDIPNFVCVVEDLGIQARAVVTVSKVSKRLSGIAKKSNSFFGKY